MNMLKQQAVKNLKLALYAAIIHYFARGLDTQTVISVLDDMRDDLTTALSEQDT